MLPRILFVAGEAVLRAWELRDVLSVRAIVLLESFQVQSLRLREVLGSVVLRPHHGVSRQLLNVRGASAGVASRALELIEGRLLGVALFAEESLYGFALVEQVLAVLEERTDVEWQPLLLYLLNVALFEVDRGKICHASLALEFTQGRQLSLSSRV